METYLFFFISYAVSLVPIAILIWLMVKYLHRKSWQPQRKATIFALVSAILVAPVIVPAGTIFAAFIPFEVALFFVRNLGDLLWFAHPKLWQMNLAGFLVSLVVSVLIGRKLFSNLALNPDAVHPQRAG